MTRYNINPHRSLKLKERQREAITSSSSSRTRRHRRLTVLVAVMVSAMYCPVLCTLSAPNFTMRLLLRDGVGDRM